jgi:hypothetical protein
VFNFSSRELAIQYAGILSNIQEILESREFYWDLTEIKSFWNSEDDGARVYAKLADAWSYPATVKPMGLKRFKPWYRRVTAETKGKVIELNPKFMNRDHADQANTLVHEWLHTRGYGHIYNNRTKHPIILKSVPYVVGNLVETLYRKNYE